MNNTQQSDFYPAGSLIEDPFAQYWPIDFLATVCYNYHFFTPIKLIGSEELKKNVVVMEESLFQTGCLLYFPTATRCF